MSVTATESSPRRPPGRWRATVRRRLDPEERFGIRLTLFAGALILLALPFGFLLDQVANHRALVDLDASAAKHLHAWVVQSPGRVRLLKDITFLGSGLWLFSVVTVAAIGLAIRRRARLVLFLVASTALGGVIDSVVKTLVNRPRPVFLDPVLLEPGKSFPSGHALSSTVVYGALLLVAMPLIPRVARLLTTLVVVALVAAIGFTRLALGVHYLTDVLGGYVLGLAWLSLSAAAFSVWRKERTGKPTKPTEGLEPEIAEPRTDGPLVVPSQPRPDRHLN